MALPVTVCVGQGKRVPRRAGRNGPDGVAPRVQEGVFLFSARGGSGPWGVFHAPHDDAAEGTEFFVHTVILKLTLRHKTDFTDRAAASAASAASACRFRSFRRFYVSFLISVISYLV